jgi:hypothetical protein
VDLMSLWNGANFPDSLCKELSVRGGGVHEGVGGNLLVSVCLCATHCASTSADGFHGRHVTLGRCQLLFHSVRKEVSVWGRLACEPIQAVPMPTRASLSVESIRFSCAMAWIRCVACYSRSRTGVKLPIDVIRP